MTIDCRDPSTNTQFENTSPARLPVELMPCRERPQALPGVQASQLGKDDKITSSTWALQRILRTARQIHRSKFQIALWLCLSDWAGTKNACHKLTCKLALPRSCARPLQGYTAGRN